MKMIEEGKELSASKLRIVGFNSNSIGKNPKRRRVLHFLQKKQPDLIVILDTRICKSLENIVTEEWGGQCLFSSFTSQSRGVAMFLRKGSTVTFLDHCKDTNGNLLCVLADF